MTRHPHMFIGGVADGRVIEVPEGVDHYTAEEPLPLLMASENVAYAVHRVNQSRYRRETLAFTSLAPLEFFVEDTMSTRTAVLRLLSYYRPKQ